MKDKSISENIKKYIYELGFDACGFAKAEEIELDIKDKFKIWLDRGYHAEMGYMENHFEKRCNPSLLVEGAKSVISLAMNYYPDVKQENSNPQFAYYAYGKDYHDIVKDKLKQLLAYIETIAPNVQGRVFCDTAPLMERYWAARSGIGFIGKNSLLIIPNKGSFFFLGQVVVNIALDYDKPIDRSCGKCQRCIEACPTHAIVKEKVIDCNRCISYQTIENRGEIDPFVAERMSGYVYGCDICQKVCPWNRFATKTHIEEFKPSSDFLSLNTEGLLNLSEEEYRRIFKGSAVKRAKLDGLRRNIKALVESKNNI